MQILKVNIFVSIIVILFNQTLYTASADPNPPRPGLYDGIENYVSTLIYGQPVDHPAVSQAVDIDHSNPQDHHDIDPAAGVYPNPAPAQLDPENHNSNSSNSTLVLSIPDEEISDQVYTYPIYEKGKWKNCAVKHMIKKRVKKAITNQPAENQPGEGILSSLYEGIEHYGCILLGSDEGGPSEEDAPSEENKASLLSAVESLTFGNPMPMINIMMSSFAGAIGDMQQSHQLSTRTANKKDNVGLALKAIIMAMMCYLVYHNASLPTGL